MEKRILPRKTRTCKRNLFNPPRVGIWKKMLSTNFRRNAIGAIGDATGKRKVQKPSDIPGLRRKKAKKVSLRQNGVFIVDLQSSRSARTPKRKSAKKVEFHNSLFNTVD